ANGNPQRAGTFTYNLRFPGQIFMGPAGLHQNYFRDYDPATGRYIESDPIGLAGRSYSTYAYARGNLLTYVDALGMATAGVPLNSLNCDALKKIIDYENEYGKLATVLNYNPVNFSEDAVALDASFDSLGGPVSIDWMMKSALFGLTTLPGTPLFTYSFG